MLGLLTPHDLTTAIQAVEARLTTVEAQAASARLTAVECLERVDRLIKRYDMREQRRTSGEPDVEARACSPAEQLQERILSRRNARRNGNGIPQHVRG